MGNDRIPVPDPRIGWKCKPHMDSCPYRRSPFYSYIIIVCSFTTVITPVITALDFEYSSPAPLINFHGPSSARGLDLNQLPWCLFLRST